MNIIQNPPNLTIFVHMELMKEHYEAPATEVVEVKMEVNILSNMGTEDYIFGGLDE